MRNRMTWNVTEASEAVVYEGLLNDLKPLALYR